MIKIRKTNLECPLESINLVAQGRAPTWLQPGLERLIEGGFGVKSVPVKNREKAHGWKSANRGCRRVQRGGQNLSLLVVGEGLYDPPALVSRFQRGGRGATATDPGWRIHRGFCDVCDDGSNHMHMHGNPASAGLGLRVRQNDQNSQNEPGMSFGINKPCRTRPGPEMVVTGSRGPDRRTFG